jgi:hypothetical protein
LHFDPSQKTQTQLQMQHQWENSVEKPKKIEQLLKLLKLGSDFLSLWKKKKISENKLENFFFFSRLMSS